MATIYYVTGGERSGKTGFATKLAKKLDDSPVYLATARHWDDDFTERIKRHQKERGSSWETIEVEKELAKIEVEGKTVVLDCITLWLTNVFFDLKSHTNDTLIYAKEQWLEFTNQDFNLVVITNEIGMGVHAPTRTGRKFVEIQGWMNQFIAKMSHEAWLMVSGIPVKIK